MKRAIEFGLLTLIAMSQPSYAIKLEDCMKFPNMPDRTKCLYGNEVALNTELERLVKKVEDPNNGLEAAVGGLADKIDNPETGLGSVLRYGSKVQIQSIVVPGKCIDQRSNPEPHPDPDKIKAVTCAPLDPENRWVLAR